MKRLIAFTMLTGIFLAGCPAPESRYVIHRPTPIVVDVDLCEAAEVNLKAKQCIPVDEPYTKKGKSFTQFCKDKQAQGVYLNPKCLAHVTECHQVDACTGTE